MFVSFQPNVVGICCILPWKVFSHYNDSDDDAGGTFVVGGDDVGNPPLPSNSFCSCSSRLPHPPLHCLQCTWLILILQCCRTGLGPWWWCTSFPDKGRDPAFDLHRYPSSSSSSCTTNTSAAVPSILVRKGSLLLNFALV